MPDFKDMLKYYRQREQLSQSQLAQKLGISSSTISMYEVGKREPDFETEERIADFFNIDLNTLRGKDTEAPTYGPDIHQLINNYNRLNDLGKAEATKRVEELTFLPMYSSSAGSDDDVVLMAAHERTDIKVTKDMKKHDDDIMNDENF